MSAGVGAAQPVAAAADAQGTALDVVIHEANLGKYNTNRFQLKGHAVLVIRGIALAMTIKRFEGLIFGLI